MSKRNSKVTTTAELELVTTTEQVATEGADTTTTEPPVTVEQTAPEMVMLTMGDTEAGLVAAENATTEAQALANEHGCTVTLRHPTTDEVVGTTQPEDAAVGGVSAPLAPSDGTDGTVVAGAAAGTGDAVISTTSGAGHVEHRTTVLPGAVFPSEGHAEAWARADGLTKRDFKVIAVEGGYAFEKITRVKLEKPKAEKKTGPTGKVAEIIALALRPDGVTAAELNKLTGWTGAPWKWNFSNPKDGGWSAKWGYGFFTSNVGGVVHYHLTKPDAEEQAAA